MSYTIRDILVVTGLSGNLSTVFMDIPSSDKIIAFNFVACIDGEGNDYPIVEIGMGTGKYPEQIWMAVDPKTTN